MKNFLKEYRVEIFALLFVLVGVFLVIEKMDIRGTILQVILQTGVSAKTFLQSALKVVSGYITSFTLSDLIGWILIIATGVFVLWRFRYRFSRSERWRATVCPRCGGPIHRIHRTSLDRILSKTFLPHVYRYQCENSECDWSGLRHHRHDSIHHSPHLEQEFQEIESNRSQ